MKVVDALIRKENDGTLSFGDYSRPEKTKLADFEHAGDIYKVKTFTEITKLERNDKFVYESVPGSAVFNYSETDKTIEFGVSASGDIQITLELEPSKEYDVVVDGNSLGRMESNVGGKLVFSIEGSADSVIPVKIIKD